MKYFLNYTILFAIALTFGWAFMEAREWIEGPTSPTETSPQWDDEWCLIDILDSAGGQIVSDSAGSDTYRIIGTTHGYEVYQKCSKQ